MRGTWTMTRSVIDRDDTMELHYRLVLRPDGEATMVVERDGSLRRSREFNERFGSILYAYLSREERVIHQGRWTGDRDGDTLTIRLTEIAGRRDVATFTGQREGDRLRLTTSNPGMYGERGRFVFRSATNDTGYDRDDSWNRDRYGRDGWENRRDDRYNPDDQRRDRPGRWGDRRNESRGSLTWQGDVDDGAILYIRQNTIRTETTNAVSVNNIRSHFSTNLPSRPVRVTLTRIEGRGQVTILEQPGPQNNYTAVVKIKDADDGASNYRFTLNWE
jgi:hypothetical protein